LSFRDTPAGDGYVFIYLTSGSEKNVWSRTLVNSVMAAVAPRTFATEALSAGLIDYALKPATGGDAAAQADRLRAQTAVRGAALENTVNGTGYAVREIIGLAESIRLFELNTLLFPSSANAWDSLAEAWQAQGDTDKAKQLYEKSRALGAPK
jgi:tetratricopeptide (TPR) repeat protein